MNIYLGTKGLKQGWQDEFPETVKCNKCGGEARVMFVVSEDGTEKEAICNLHPNEGKGGYWVHDYCAVAVYLCRDCFEINGLQDQA